MIRFTVGRGVRLAAAAVAASLLLAGCASGSSSSAGGGATSAAPVGLVGNQGSGGDPVRGGTLTYATYAPVSNLDPATMLPSGATGGSEAAAIYDLLVRYNDETKKYEPQLAKTVQVSDDQKTWTLTLRDGVKFSDGTPVDADAVTWSINRYLDKRGISSQLFKDSVAAMTAPNPSTVVFALNQPWPQFWSMLTTGPGLIAAPSSMQSGTFTPIGAGPFSVARFAPQDELVLEARPDYWGGTPNLDQLRFVNITGDQPKVDALKSGGVQMVYLRSAETIDQERAAGAPGYLSTENLGNVGLINNRPGRPGSDVRVRQAMAYAVNPDVIDQRVNAGKGMPGSTIFQPWSQWHSDVTPLGYDPDKARQLLDAAKADGYNGNLTYVAFAEPKAQAQALAVQAMLQSVGFTVTVSYANNAQDVTKKVYVDQDFDLARGAFSVWEAAPDVRLSSSLSSTSSSNAMGYQDPAMDALLATSKSATTDDAHRAALADIQRSVNEKVPFLAWGAQATLIEWQDNVHGVKPSLDGFMLFDKAWLKP